MSVSVEIYEPPTRADRLKSLAVWHGMEAHYYRNRGSKEKTAKAKEQCREMADYHQDACDFLDAFSEELRKAE